MRRNQRTMGLAGQDDPGGKTHNPFYSKELLRMPVESALIAIKSETKKPPEDQIKEVLSTKRRTFLG